MDNSDTAEYRAFQSYFEKLVNGVKNDVESVATKAFTKNLISSDNLSNAMDRHHADEKHRAIKLLQQVLDKIHQNPSYFYTFIAILKEILSLEELAGELMRKSQSDMTMEEPDSLHHLWRPRASAVTHDTITLEWDTPKLDRENVNVMSYLVKYCCTSDGPWINIMMCNNDTQLTIPGLTPQTKYIFKVRPELDDGGVGAESEESFPIKTKPLPCQPGRPTASAATHDSITVEWSKPEHRNETVRSYRVRYCVNNQSKSWTPVMTDNNETNFTATNLTPQTEYIFKVRPELKDNIDPVGTESEVSDPIATKATSPPGKPVKCSTTHKSITLNWTRPEIGGERIKYYEILCGILHESVLRLMPGTITSQPQQEIIVATVHSLLNGKKYTFKVRAVCSTAEGKDILGMESHVSDPIETKTTSPPGKPVAIASTHNSITLEWMKPELGSTDIERYTIYCSKDGSRWNILTQQETSKHGCCTVQNLQLNTYYSFKVLPVCRKGTGSYSEPSERIKTKVNSPPGKPVAIKITHKSVHLKWTKPKLFITGLLCSYSVIYVNQSSQTEVSVEHPRSGDNTEFVVDGLQPNTSYIFQIHPVCSSSNCYVSDSESSDPITTYPECKPDKLIAVETYCESVALSWNKPKNGGDQIKHYTVYFKRIDDSQWYQQQTQSDETSLVISELKDMTQHTFKVQAELKYDTNIGVEFSDAIQVTTKPPLAVYLFREAQSKRLLLREGPPAVYELPGVTYTMRDEEKKIAKCHFGDPKLGRGKQERVLMLVGATGAGKSTLIECMVNYILGVKWEDDFRFKLIKEKVRSHVESQTRFITTYTFFPVEGSALDYTLTIIDTLGYGDTRGIKHENSLSEQIKHFFSAPPPHGIDHIDGVGFVAKASSARLTPTQQYIFDSILGAFGRDMERNIFLMITFADAEKPRVLEAIQVEGIPNVGHFKFNNSVLYADNSDSTDTVSSSFWKIGSGALGQFFTKFESMESISLQLTRETLAHREELETLLEVLHRQITTSLDLIRELKQEREAIVTAHQRVVDTKPFYYEVEVFKGFEEPLPDKNKQVTICLRCNYTCHYPCTIKNDEKKYKCAAMEGNYFQRNKDSCCKECPGKCHWTCHVNRPYRYVQRPVKVKRTLEDLIMKYSSTSRYSTPSPPEQHSATEDMLERIAKRLNEAFDKVLDLIKQAQESIDKLDQIALLKSDSTRDRNPQVAYIELLIEAEKRGCKPGCEQRIEALKVLKERA